MKHLRSKLIPVALIFAALLFPFCSFAQQGTTSLEDYRKALQRQEQAVLAQYGKDLETTLVALKQKGDLDNYLVFETEKKRFEAEQTVPEPAVVFDAFRPQVETYYRARANLLKKYITALDGFLQKLMMANRIDEAKNVRTEKESVVVMINDLESKLPQPNEMAPPSTAKSDKVEGNKAPGQVIPGRKPIPDDAVDFNGHHYKLLTDSADWEKASFKCRTLGGHLVVISDSEENDFVHDLMREQRAAWIGASKDMATWRWCIPARFEYQNWAPGQPDSGKKMGFKAAMSGDRGGQWDDQPGDNHEVSAYICEWDY